MKDIISAPIVREQSANITQIESSKLLPWLMLCCVLSGFAVAFSIMTYAMNEKNFQVLWDKYQLVEREARLAQDDVTKYLKRGNDQ